MKNYLVVTLGAPASGKSTFLKEKGLEKYVVSSDQIRLLYAAPVQTETGKYGVSQGKDKRVWETLKNVVEDRVEKGEFTIIDATHTRPKYWKNYVDLCNKHGAQLVCLDFRGVQKEELNKRDATREEHKQVGEDVIARFYEQSQTLKMQKEVKVLKPENWEEFFKFEWKDLSEYKKVHHIGDIHGCFEPLKEYFNEGLKEDEFYVFVGDYVDRGLQNAEVVEFMMTVKNRKNVVLLQGNHEAPLWKWSKGEQPRSNEFKRYTQPELEQKGIQQKKAFSLVYGMNSYFSYQYGDKNVLVNHGGIVKVPEYKYEVTSEQLIRGVGTYEFDVDGAFTEHNDENHYQVHGHRNIYKMPIEAAKNSYNLEGQVERGGNLRIVTLNESGFEGKEIKNNVFSNRFLSGKVKDHGNQKLLNELRSDKGIRESKQRGDLSSFNFAESVFHDNNWTSRRIKTRGLFMNTQTTEIVARGYDKFFNVGEFRHTEMESLKKTLKFPVEIFEKENGYLGMNGYDSAHNKMLLTTKMTVKGEYADLFKGVWDKCVSVDSEEKIREFVRTSGTSLTFEVIDPKNDPHMVYYEKEKIVLLDIIHRKEQFEKYPYDELVKTAEHLGLEVKKRTTVVNTFEELEQFIEEFSTMDNTIEGYVLEDVGGYQVKVKLPYYRYWKWTRSQMNRLKKGRKMDEEYLKHPESIRLNIEKELKRVLEERKEWVEKEDMAQIGIEINERSIG